MISGTVPALALFLWLYLKLAPSGTTFRSPAGFEITILILEVAGCAAANWYSWSTVGQGVDRAWWPFIAFFYCMFLIPAVLIFAAIVRELV